MVVLDNIVVRDFLRSHLREKDVHHRVDDLVAMTTNAYLLRVEATRLVRYPDPTAALL